LPPELPLLLPLPLVPLLLALAFELLLLLLLLPKELEVDDLSFSRAVFLFMGSKFGFLACDC
jgi:hypothetical protein